MIVPPPTPKRPLNTPAAVAITNSFSNRSRGTGGDTSGVTNAPGVTERVAELIAPLRDEPRASAVLCDIDGTLAPITADPEDSAVPEEGRAVLRELARRYSLVACVTGRQATEARRIVGVEELVYFGNHGLELLKPEASEPSLDPAVAEQARRTREFVLDLDPDEV